MNRLNIRKTIIIWFLTAILCIAGCAPAFASAGDRTLIHYSVTDAANNMNIQGVYRTAEGICVYLYGGMDRTLLRYADTGAEPEKFDLGMADMTEYLQTGSEDAGQNEEDPNYYYSGYTDLAGWFSWKGELYALLTKMKFDEMNTSLESLIIRRVKLGDGKIILEDSGLPEPDTGALMDDMDDSQYFYPDRLFTAGDLLVGSYWGSAGQEVFAFDLTTGFYTGIDSEGTEEIVPGPDGSVILSKVEWKEEGSDITLIRMDPENQSQEELVTVTGVTNYRISPCFDAGYDNMYYVKDGELWKMPQLDTGLAQAVNDCPITPNGSMLLDGFVLLWSNDTVLTRNTDPEQRGGTAIRVRDNSGSQALNETAFAMNNNRGDVSVIVQQDWGRIKSDVLQAMMNHDGYTDIYVLQYDSSDFRALLSRGYLTDMSGDARIAGAVERMYPYIQEVLRKDGRLIAIPVDISGQVVGVDRNIWQKAGGTEEELPKTWDQFFDWLETLPDRLSGIEAIASNDSRDGFVYAIRMMLLSQYQVWMDSKGEDWVFNNPELVGLLSRANSVDCDALGLKSYEEGYDAIWRDPLVSTYARPVMNEPYMMEGDPLPLAFEEGGDAILPVEMSVAFVNPYSEHREEAMEFLALLLDNLTTSTQYSLYTDRKEPIRSSYYEENLKSATEWLEQTKEQLEREENAEFRALLEDNLKEAEEFLEYVDRENWIISPKMIEDYIQRIPALRIMDYNFLYDITGSVADEAEQNALSTLFYSVESDPVELAATIDRKIRMIRMEGN